MMPAKIMPRKEQRLSKMPSDLVDDIPRTITSNTAEYDCLDMIGSVSVFSLYIFRINCNT